jgi:hypothetical protein
VGSIAAGSGAAAAPAPRQPGKAASDGTSEVLPNGSSLIITAGLQVKTDDTAAAAAAAQQLVEVAGGYVAAESVGSGTQTESDLKQLPEPSGAASTGDLPAPIPLPAVGDAGGAAQALLVLRVPPPQLDQLLRSLAGKGTVTYQTRSQSDVTGQTADIDSRVASAQTAIADLRGLLGKAASLNDLVSLEQALAQRESDLESLEAQQKALTDQVQYATVTVGYFSQGAAVPPPPSHNGFVQGAINGWHGFTHILRGVLLALGWVLPYSAAAVVLWWPVRRAVRRGRERARRSLSGAALAAGPTIQPPPAAPSSEV